MTKYVIPVTDKVVWDDVPKAFIKNYKWGNDYMPVAYGQIAYVDGKGFAVRLVCHESSPKAEYFNYGDPVHTDSCLEFFPSFNNQSPYYINLEANANGAYVCGKRTSRYDKVPADQIIAVEELRPKAEIRDGYWSVEYFIKNEIIDALFGVSSFPEGYTFKGNMYKCGEKTAVPHYGSLYPIDLPSPDFHCPQFFGDFEIGKKE